MTKSYSFIAVLAASLFFSCGGGGVSDEFTREINDVHTAWKNATASFTASMDSVQQAKAAWATMMTQMNVPDTLQANMTPEYKAQVDSVKEICQREGESYDALTKELETAKATWDSDTKMFTDWKDKVFKSEIDIETARKDLKDYQEKVKQTTGVSDKMTARLTEIRQHCAANCRVYDNLVAGIPKEAPAPTRRRGR